MRLPILGGPANWINNFQRFAYRCSAVPSEKSGKNQQQSVILCWTPFSTGRENNLIAHRMPVKQLISAPAVLPTDFKS